MTANARIKKYIDMLIQGLEKKGKYYNIINKRFYSDRVGRYCMKYILEDLNGESKKKIEVYNKVEILKYLVREWSRETGTPVPASCVEVYSGEEGKENIKKSERMEKKVKIPVFDKYDTKKNKPKRKSKRKATKSSTKASKKA